MTALAPRFGLTGDVQCFAGEVLSAELAFTNGSDATIPLTGRQFAMTVWVGDTTRAEVASVAGEIVSDSSGHYARFTIGGDATEAMYQAHGALGLRVMIAELLDDGIDVKVEGALRIRPSPAGITPDAAPSSGGPPVSRYTFDMSSQRVIVSARGAPGLTGAAGATGPVGATGATGAAGLSAAQQLYAAGLIDAATTDAMFDYLSGANMRPSGVTPLVATLATGSSMSGPFTPVIGSRPIVFTRSGGGTGTTQLLRSTDGGTTKLPLTVGGAAWGSYPGDVNEPAWTETESGATFYVSATGITGTVKIRLAQ